ncbi:MAG: tRNA (adenosine(37)-N6)-dimethylallyltransferase MiaA [Oscillospiraceae bacterium]|nr:tRNA (adenosine(37)-N6)-dimethylallyltransferase MiaA [Oscillospiraceae bacterium]
MPSLVLVITGPTATGKTALGVELAQKLNGEVVSADSMQIYEHMDIGTAKVTPEETKGIPHHMVGCISPFEEYSAARYVEDAAPICEDILSRGKLPIIVGGTGLYIDSLLAGRTFAERGNPEVRDRLSSEYDNLGGEALYERLKEVDPEASARLHANDKKRIVRALEIFEVTGITMTEHDRASREIPPRFDAVKIALSFENREDLYARIDKRVDIMAEMGLLNEVKKLLGMGLNEHHTAMQAIGYKELVDAILHGSSIDAALDKIKQESRRYAKRQLSWLRRDSEINWILHPKTPQIDDAVRLSTEFLNKHR